MLTDIAARKAKPKQKQVKLWDERGLFLLVAPNGSKLWRLKYRIAGREKLLALGAYPDVSLADARERREAARKLIAAGVDPVTHRRLEQAEKRAATTDTFEAIAREWFASRRWAPSHARTVLARLEDNVFPFIGSRPIRDITPPDVLLVLRKIEARGAFETAHRVQQICSQVLRYAVGCGKAISDPTRDLRGLLTPVQTTHHAAITDPKQAAGLLRVLDAYDGSIVVRCALRLAPLVFVRPGELRKAEWAEIDFDRGLWVIPAERMKMRQSLIVPLSRQAIAILRELQPVTGDGRYVFPSARDASRPMSDNAVLAALRRSGVAQDEMTGHGFRALARTILDEVLHVRVDLIEHQLGHAVRDPLGSAYNRTSFLPERVEMMQQWADYLDGLKAGSMDVSTIKQSA